MSAVRQIYKTKTVSFCEKNMTVTIKYNNNIYYGWSSCHPDDYEFYSEKIGYNIAYKRAIISCLRYQTTEAKNNWKYLKTVYSNIMMSQDPQMVDPTGRMEAAVYRAQKQYKRFYKDLMAAKKDLQNYLEAQARVVESLRRQRAKND